MSETGASPSTKLSLSKVGGSFILAVESDTGLSLNLRVSARMLAEFLWQITHFTEIAEEANTELKAEKQKAETRRQQKIAIRKTEIAKLLQQHWKNIARGLSYEASRDALAKSHNKSLPEIKRLLALAQSYRRAEREALILEYAVADVPPATIAQKLETSVATVQRFINQAEHLIRAKKLENINNDRPALLPTASLSPLFKKPKKRRQKQGKGGTHG